MNAKKGMSLLELLVVLGILGVVLALVAVHLGGTVDDAKATRIDADLSLLVGAAEQYVQRHPESVVRGQDVLIEAGVLSEAVESPIEGYHYHVESEKGVVCARLMKGEVVYEKGEYRGEKTSTRLYLD